MWSTRADLILCSCSSSGWSTSSLEVILILCTCFSSRAFRLSRSIASLHGGAKRNISTCNDEASSGGLRDAQTGQNFVRPAVPRWLLESCWGFWCYSSSQGQDQNNHDKSRRASVDQQVKSTNKSGCLSSSWYTWMPEARLSSALLPVPPHRIQMVWGISASPSSLELPLSSPCPGEPSPDCCCSEVSGCRAPSSASSCR